MKKKALSLLLAATTVTTLLAGCGGKKEEAPAATTAASAEAESTAGGQPEGEIDKSQLITIYTNNGSEGRDVWLVDRAAEAGYNVQVVGLGASDVANRMIAEKNNPLCDVVFGLNSIEFEKLKAQDLLQTWEPDWTDGVDASLIDADGYYYPVTTTPLVIITNNEYQNPPTDWVDLTKDEYKGLYQLHGLSGGTGKTIFASIITRYADPNGDLGISDEGWAIAEKYLGNAHLIASGEDSIGAVIDGSLPIDMHWASGVLTEQKVRNYKFNIVSPEIGVPYVVESLAIAKGTENYDLCVDFLNWLGSPEIQLEWSNNFGTIPCQEEALANATEDVKELMSTLKPQELDWGFIAENIDAWVEKAELQYVQ